MKRKSHTLKVGIATVVMMTLITMLLIWQSTLVLRSTGYELIGKFDSVGGLLNQAEVRYRGYRVGRAAKIVPRQDGIYVYFWVNGDVQIPHGSSLRVVFDGLVGEKYLDIIPNPEGDAFLEPKSVLIGYSTAGIADFVDVGTRNLEEIQTVLSTFRKLSTDENIISSVEKSIHSVASITENMDKILVQIRGLSEKTDIEQIATNINTLSERLANTIDDDFTEDLDVSIKNLRYITDELSALFDKDGDKPSGTVSEGKNMFRATGSIINTISSIDFKTGMNLQYAPSKKDYWVDGNLDIWLNNSYLRVGVGNRYGEDALMNVQQGLELVHNVRTRFGVFYSKPGVGVDYKLYSLLLSSDFYSFKELQWDAFARYPLIQHVDLSLGMNDILDKEKRKAYMLGLSIHTY